MLELPKVNGADLVVAALRKVRETDDHAAVLQTAQEIIYGAATIIASEGRQR
jgi:hypothetical protein